MAEYMEPEMVTMEDAAGNAAEEAYTAALESGADPSAAASAAIEAAGAVMTEMGAPADMVDTMSSAAQDGFRTAFVPVGNSLEEWLELCCACAHMRACKPAGTLSSEKHCRSTTEVSRERLATLMPTAL